VTWLKEKAWPWLKKYWVWLLFPVGIVIYILGCRSGSTTVLSPGSVEAERAKKEAEDRAAEKLAKAKAERDARIAGIEKEHKEVIDKLTEEQKKDLKNLREDPEKLNAFLKNVGRSIRG
jgi:hypothetical protein